MRGMKWRSNLGIISEVAATLRLLATAIRQHLTRLYELKMKGGIS
jgi:hypothetical protein